MMGFHKEVCPSALRILRAVVDKQAWRLFVHASGSLAIVWIFLSLACQQAPWPFAVLP
jgi:hypothetical protein